MHASVHAVEGGGRWCICRPKVLERCVDALHVSGRGYVLYMQRSNKGNAPGLPAVAKLFEHHTFRLFDAK